MVTSREQIGIWRVVREGFGVQLQTFYPDEQQWKYVRLSRQEVLALIEALNEVVKA